MAKTVKLAVAPRSEVGRNAVKKIKTEGFVPAVFYSHNVTPENLKVSERQLNQVLAHAAGDNILVDLSVEGGAGSRMALVQEVQYHPVSQRILHVDFQGVSANEEVESSIPVEPVGEAVGVKVSGGILQHLLRTVTIKSLPKDLPTVITVDVSGLEAGGTIHVKDLQLPAGVKVVDDGEIPVFLIAELKGAAATEEAPEKK